MSEMIIVAAISSLAGLISSSLIFFIAWRKTRPEINKLNQESHACEADAAESALKTTDLASKQVITMQTELYDERDKRMKLENKVANMEVEIAKLTGRIVRLEAQVVSLGAEPVK